MPVADECSNGEVDCVRIEVLRASGAANSSGVSLACMLGDRLGSLGRSSRKAAANLGCECGDVLRIARGATERVGLLPPATRLGIAETLLLGAPDCVVGNEDALPLVPLACPAP